MCWLRQGSSLVAHITDAIIDMQYPPRNRSNIYCFLSVTSSEMSINVNGCDFIARRNYKSHFFSVRTFMLESILLHNSSGKKKIVDWSEGSTSIAITLKSASDFMYQYNKIIGIFCRTAFLCRCVCTRVNFINHVKYFNSRIQEPIFDFFFYSVLWMYSLRVTNFSYTLSIWLMINETDWLRHVYLFKVHFSLTLWEKNKMTDGVRKSHGDFIIFNPCCWNL